jgi:co-chaperonin GroES (HSP10)
MLNGNILCKEIHEENKTASGLILGSVKKNYRKFKIINSPNPKIKENSTVYTQMMNAIEWNEFMIINEQNIIMVE